MKNLCGVKTMYAMEEQFNEKNCIENLRILSGDKSLKEMPHSDTLNLLSETAFPKLPVATEEETDKKTNPDEKFSEEEISGTVLADHSGWNGSVLL